MTEDIRSDQGKVLVGIKMDEHSKRLLENMQHFCVRTKMSLRAVHVVEHTPVMESSYSSIFGSFDITELASDMRDDELREAQLKIQEMIKSLPHLCPTESHVVGSLNSTESLLLDAEASQANMLVIGMDRHPYKIIPRGFSVVLGLMTATSRPLLIVRRGGNLDFNRDSYTMLISDDLSSAGESVVARGMQLASSLGRTEIMHVHVIEPRIQNFEKFIASSPRKSSLNVSDLVSFAEARIDEMLHERAKSLLAAALNAGCTYKAKVVVGHTAGKISAMLKEIKPHIAVFGRHETFHTKPFGIGSVPFGAILAECDGILLVPPV